MAEYTEERMFAALYRRYGPVGANTAGVCLRHVPAYVDTPFGNHGYVTTKKRYIDALIFANPLKPRLWAVEIKVTKQDLDLELRDISKSEAWARHVHSFYLAVPPGILDYALDNSPKTWGVLSYLGHGVNDPRNEKLWVIRRAKINKSPEELDRRTWWAMARRAGKNDYQHCKDTK